MKFFNKVFNKTFLIPSIALVGIIIASRFLNNNLFMGLVVLAIVWGFGNLIYTFKSN